MTNVRWCLLTHGDVAIGATWSYDQLMSAHAEKKLLNTISATQWRVGAIITHKDGSYSVVG